MAYLGIYEGNSGLSDLRLYTDPSSVTRGKVCSICYHRIQTFKAQSVVVQDVSGLGLERSSPPVHFNIILFAGLWVFRTAGLRVRGVCLITDPFKVFGALNVFTAPHKDFSNSWNSKIKPFSHVVTHVILS